MTDTSTTALYQQVIMDHARERHGAGLQDTAAATAHQINPTCGDEVTVQVHLNATGEAIESLSWDGMGCSISQASVSMLHDLVPGMTTGDVTTRIAAFRAMIHSQGADEGDPELLGDAVALSGVSRYVARVKCAMLGWVALEGALGELSA
ncbi:Fe-S cluster assembly sulfur transfer protein SufU [Rathayibacter soli]|uniref:Fe-S cluster assembly sulfur transfer protein SufU n=1 Tax=Rathayibacter soli TaxID=3144168 RepID=UPI0027E3FAE6|nr:SUF system NifU family Fe-S cluster assembly protein [Glaciibacter superstes]